jgi:hypothetical protein
LNRLPQKEAPDYREIAGRLEIIGISGGFRQE